jgi:hypothetical protein
LDEHLSFGIEGAKFTPAYVSKGWDGRKHMMSVAKQQFPTGLLPNVLEKLAELGLTPRLNDNRTAPTLDCPVIPLTVEPWEHQTKIFNTCITSPRGLI